jgi:hypothetical protein
MSHELSVFVDESGDRGGNARYYLVTLMLHNQVDDISEKVTRLEESLVKPTSPTSPFIRSRC